VTELVTKVGLSFQKAEYLAKKRLELKSLEGKAPLHSVVKEEVDTDLQKLQHDVAMAELRRKKAELERPLDVDQKFDALHATLDGIGGYKHENCRHSTGGYCLGWYWSQKPDVPYQKGEPLSKEDRWYINPTLTRCSICPIYLNKGEQTLQEAKDALHQEILELPSNVASELGSLLDSKLDRSEICDRFHCSCGAERQVAIRVICRKCGREYLLGLLPD